ncbi:kinase-like domain-containing protein [Mycotypha africana]|uniref:kinase-like domain-containing protein n=1 Tax=Mycotypha africana TaxID=64632 RepID=UPI002300778D|nr:kinase-like domain-containing protein [Mycotypha africana]KAI8991321.1 kinase-like domain-containing protein [Mycotypha africana]
MNESLCNQYFLQQYELKDHIGYGGYSFVMSALQRTTGREVAVKFIYKHKLSKQQLVFLPAIPTTTAATATITEERGNYIPKEIAILMRIKHHPTVIDYVDYFEDQRYYYLVMELFGTEWGLCDKKIDAFNDCIKGTGDYTNSSDSHATGIEGETNSINYFSDCRASSSSVESSSPVTPMASTLTILQNTSLAMTSKEYAFIEHQTSKHRRHRRRSSSDLFECIEALLKHKHLQEQKKKHFQERKRINNNCSESNVVFSEAQIKTIFRQIIQCAYDLSKIGIYHRDIKDENIVIDSSFKVKLIDFGAAIQIPIVQTSHGNTSSGRHHHRSSISSRSGITSNATTLNTAQKFSRYKVTKFLGTVTFASPEILLGLDYKPEPAEVWSLGVLLYTLLFGQPPFYSSDQVMKGQWLIPGSSVPLTTLGNDTAEATITQLSENCLHLLKGLLRHHPEQRLSLEEILNHPWLAEAV